MVISYGPGCNSTMRYAPFSLDVAECTAPVCGLFTVMLTPAIGAPDPSTIVPVTVAFCAEAPLTVIKKAAIPHVANFRNFLMNPPSTSNSSPVKQGYSGPLDATIQPFGYLRKKFAL